MSNPLIAISNHGNMLGGGEHSFLDLLSHLPKPWNVLAVLPGEGELATRLERKGIQTEVISLPSIRPWSVLGVLSCLKRYFNLLRRYRPTLIYANGSRAGFYAGIVGQIQRIPMIWHCRIADPDIWLDLILTRLSTGIIANSRATANRFRERFQSKVTVVHNGVDLGWLRDDSVPKPGLIDDSWKVILVVARASRWKRHDLALSAFEEVATKEPNAHLVCVGSSDALEPEWWKYLQDRSHQSRVSNRIHWVDQVADIRPWYRAAHMLLLPSENEPFGRVLVEAMACCVPVIASRSGGVTEIVRPGKEGLLVTPGNANEMADAMITILGDDHVREDLVRSASTRAKIFSLDIHVKKITRIFEEAIHLRG